MPSEWARLTQHLGRSGQDRVVLSYDDLEGILGQPLPPVARSNRTFWSNGRKTYSRHWLEADYIVSLASLPPDQVAFNRDPALADVFRQRRSDLGPPLDTEPSALLIGCVATKAAGPRPAKDLYTSELFRGRRAYAEASGKPWVILSAKHGVVDPDEVLEPYEQRVTDFRGAERDAWSANVVEGLDRRFGLLAGKVFEIHAGDEYVRALLPPLRRSGAGLLRPLQGLRLGEQIQWYRRRTGGGGSSAPRPSVGPQPGVSRSPGSGGRGLARRISEAFWRSQLDLSARPGSPPQGAEALPEARAVRALRVAGGDTVHVRLFLTLVAAMDRARDADRLWDDAVELFRRQLWAFEPHEVSRRPLRELAELLAKSRVSQRHSDDIPAWRFIAESLGDPAFAPVVHEAVFKGSGSVPAILAALQAKSASSLPMFPMLGGPKIGQMWARMLIWPGDATLEGVSVIDVAVDVQVRKVTEYLGVTETHGRDLEQVRRLIQATWRDDVEAHGADGPEPLVNSCAALDPALWFFAKWGCTFCERAGRRLPISTICAECQFDRLHGAR